LPVLWTWPAAIPRKISPKGKNCWPKAAIRRSS
jgi:hypothetical protein